MDFGDILDQWEKSSKEKPVKQKAATGQEWRNKKMNAPEKEEVIQGKQKVTVKEEMENDRKKTVNSMEMWLRRYGVVDKDALTEKMKREDRELDRAQLRKKIPDGTIDLHGLTRDEAWTKLDNFVTECVRRKLQKILIIHGKGNHSSDNPVLALMVRTFIERDARLGESGHPEKKDGGKGATWVIIRPQA